MIDVLECLAFLVALACLSYVAGVFGWVLAKRPRQGIRGGGYPAPPSMQSPNVPTTKGPRSVVPAPPPQRIEMSIEGAAVCPYCHSIAQMNVAPKGIGFMPCPDVFHRGQV